MKTIRRLVAGILALIMLAGILPVFGAAESDRPVVGTFANDKNNSTKNRYTITKNALDQTVISYDSKTSWDCVTANVTGFTSEYTRLCITANFADTEQFDVEITTPNSDSGREILWSSIKSNYIEGIETMTSNSDGSCTFDITIPTKYSDINSKGIGSVRLFFDPEKNVSSTRSVTIFDIGFRKDGEPAYPPPDPLDPPVKPSYGVSLSQTGTYTFPAATAGYGSQAAQTVTITNTGNTSTGSLNIALSGTNSSSFTLSKTSQNSLSVGGNGTFTVVPRTGLAAGTYTAVVTVSNSNVLAQSFSVSFTVND
jgi:methionine-rich copper-binding protein CopC